jgi:hypothetical protein
MNSNTILFTSIALLLLLVSSSHGKGVFTKSDDDFEVSQQTAATFLAMDEEATTFSSMHDDSSAVFHKRESGRNCVPCKFGANPCCAPNICVKKTLRPDECQEVKTGK